MFKGDFKSPRLMSILVPVGGFERTFVTLEYIFNLVYLRLLYLNLNKIRLSKLGPIKLIIFSNLHIFFLVNKNKPIFLS